MRDINFRFLSLPTLLDVAMAADLAAQSGGERGLLATDLMDYLRQLVNE